MIKTFAFDPPALYLSGLFYSLLSLDPRDGRPWFGRASFRAGFAFALGFLLTSLGCYAVAPDWMASYRLDRELGPGGLALAGALLYAVPYLLGYALGLEARRVSRRLWWAALLAGAVLLAGVLMGTGDSLFRVGTRDEFASGRAVPLWSHRPLAGVLGAGVVVLGAYLVAVGVWQRRRVAAFESRPDAIRRVFDLEETAVVQALAERFFPRLEGVPDHAGRWEVGEEFSRYAVSMPWIQRVGLALAADLVQYLPLVVIGKPRRFTSLPDGDQDRYLAGLSHSRWIPVQVLFMVFKIGLSLLYYERPEVLDAVRARWCGRGGRPS